MIRADRFTPIDAVSIPTGELRSVKGTPFDFTNLTAIGARIDQDDQQLKLERGYDHNWVLNNEKAGSLSLAAQAYDPHSGRLLEVWKTPGSRASSSIPLLLDGIHGRDGKVYNRRDAFCLLKPSIFRIHPTIPAFQLPKLKPGTAL